MLPPAPSTKKIYLYHCLTLGFYFFYWCSHAGADVNQSARQKIVPSAWLLILPGGNYWWMWQYGQALDHVSYRRLKAADTFLLYIIASHAWLLLTFGFQPSFNWVSSDHFSSLAVVLLCGYLALCLILQIVGAAFFCATMQRKINALRQTSPATAHPAS